MNNYYKNKPKKFVYNFFLTDEEKQLIFTIKNLHRLNNRLGKDNQDYSEFIREMTCFYRNLLVDYTPQ